MKKILPLILVLQVSIAYAQPLYEQEATPSVLNETEGKLLIMEISFKNSQADWVKIYYHSPGGKPANLKNISFGDDNVFKTVTKDFIIASGQDILLTFKSDLQDTMPYLYSSRIGLTGTTEQFIMYDQNGTVMDAVCWTSDNPTSSEIQEQAELYEQEGWHSPDIESCIPSAPIKNNQSIQRYGLADTNSANDWLGQAPQEVISNTNVTDPETSGEWGNPVIQELSIPGAEEEPSIEPDPTLPSHSPESSLRAPIADPGLVTLQIPETAQPANKKISSSKSTATKKLYQNGDISTEIIISEILPNPEGTDTKKEWIEITNVGDSDIHLGNWQLDDIEGGSKPYTLPDTLTLKAGEATLIKSEDSKISLGNKEDTVRLFDFQGTSMDEIEYEESPSGQSFSRINIEREDGTDSVQWLWTDQMTPGVPNPSYRQFSGEVISEPRFEQAYSFEVKDASDATHTIFFEEKLIAGPLARATFIPGAKLLVTVHPKDNRLMQFEVIAAAPEESPFPPMFIPSIIAAILFIGGITLFLLHKKIPWQAHN